MATVPPYRPSSYLRQCIALLEALLIVRGDWSALVRAASVMTAPWAPWLVRQCCL